jgi:hypothetical protein
MPVTHTSRNGKTYYLHTGPKRGGGAQHFFSTKSAGAFAESVPAGFEIYEAVNGQVYLRRQQAKLISDDERDCIARKLERPRAGHRYKVEVRGKILTVHESIGDFGWLARLAPHLSQQALNADAERFAHYQPVLRFILADTEQRLFAPERFCFRGSVDDWIPIGPPEQIEKLAARYLKHLGQDSMYELY